MLKVKLLEYTPNPEKVIAEAAKLCYSPVGVDEIEKNLDKDKIEKFLNMLISYGHESTIEHVSFTFAAEGISRSLSHQLVRHRIASYSQQSQRYVKLDQFEYVIPPEIAKDEKAKMLFQKSMEDSQKAYNEITELLEQRYLEQGISKSSAQKKAIEDARYVFPNACETKIVFTMNARSLMNFFRHRCCNRAQWEIRSLAEAMIVEVKKVAPILFKYSGPSCVNNACPEGKMSCGSIEAVRKKYKEEL